ncbi:hypothetical protein Sgleb_06450 [Streptomyces glebosus]|uniref:Uncharacterized protein n=2 Tax=Streptomyces TaxID=1883 RepID=A0A640SND2_9ACTN|nr:MULTISPECIES: hypothetical protein [Streptomyces]BCK66713.1 hypothetical protein Srufu_006660 [Streptomyces libani subsp. rufus]GFE12598.1 hypothetical protein Sgleb_06450 [Streptomyces glebosus]GHG71485.1 hypothetical protein GCM10010513_43660 [Streptomyces glebosus]
MISTSTSASRMALTLGAVAAALALAAPTASAAQGSSLPDVNGHTDKWVEEGSPSVTYDNGYQVNSAEEVKRALEQCNDSKVSCSSTTLESKQVTKWFDVDNAGMGIGPIQNCSPGAAEINQTLSGTRTFSWGWNVGASVDITLVKDKLGVGASAQYSETNTESKSGDIRITIKPGQKGMLQLGHDMEQRVSDVTIQGGEFGGAKISGLRTEIPLNTSARADTDVVACGATLKNGR